MVRLPVGFEAHIFRRPRTGREQSYPVAHFATFALPPGVADFGDGAVAVMRPFDVFAVLLEYGPEGLGRRLFSLRGMPRDLRISDFRPYLLPRGAHARAGTQWFFTEGERPFTFYAVLGSEVLRHELVPRVNDLLSNITINARWTPAD